MSSPVFSLLLLLLLLSLLQMVLSQPINRLTTVSTRTEHETGVSFYQEFRKTSGEPLNGGGEEWVFEADSVVTNMWGGLVIGNIAKSSHVMCEKYLYAKDKHEEATYCWGFLLSGNVQFGGWHGSNSCGWYPLQRDFNHFISTRATKLIPHPLHRPQCLPFDNNSGKLKLKSIMNPRGFINGHDGLPLLKQMRTKTANCKLYVNFDKELQQFIGEPIGSLLIHTTLYRRYIVEGFTEKAALIQVDKKLINPVLSRWQGWFFIPAECLEDIPYSPK